MYGETFYGRQDAQHQLICVFCQLSCGVIFKYHVTNNSHFPQLFHQLINFRGQFVYFTVFSKHR